MPRMGRNMNQQYRLREDGRLQKGESDCIVAPGRQRYSMLFKSEVICNPLIYILYTHIYTYK